MRKSHEAEEKSAENPGREKKSIDPEVQCSAEKRE